MAEDIERADQGSTAIDSILDILNKKGRTDINGIAAACGISPAAADRLAKVLEKGKLLKIKYEFGTMYLEPIGASADVNQAKEALLETKAVLVEDDISAIETSIKRYADGIPTISKSFKDAQSNYKDKTASVQKVIKEMSNMIKMADTYVKEIKGIEEQIDALHKKAEQKFSEIDIGSSNLDKNKVEAELKQKIEMMSKMKDQVSRVELSVNSVIKNKNITMDSIKETIKSEVKALIEDLDRENSTIDKRLQHTMDETNVVKADIETQIKSSTHSISKLGEITNELKKIKTETAKLYAQLDVDYNTALNGIKKSAEIIASKRIEVGQKTDEIKALFGETSKIDDELSEIEKQIEDIKKQTEDAKAEIEKLKKEFSSIPTLKSTEQKDQALDALAANAKQTREKISKLSTEVKQMPSTGPLGKSDQSNKSE